MDAFISTVLGALVILAGFWAFLGTQFVRKDVAEVQNQNVMDALAEIKTDIRSLRDTTIVKSTVNELADKLADLLSDSRINVR